MRESLSSTRLAKWSVTPLLCGEHRRGGGGFISEVKRRLECELCEVTRANRDELGEDEEEILDVMEQAIERANIDYTGLEAAVDAIRVLRDSEESRHLALAAQGRIQDCEDRRVVAWPPR